MRRRLVCSLLIVLSLLASACAAETPAPAPTATATLLAATATPSPTATLQPTATFAPTITPIPTATPAPLEATLHIEARAEGQSFSPLMLGSNLPNWLSKAQFESEQFRRRVAASGLTLLRIPGGSFSDEYGWLSCELGYDVPGAYPCTHNWVRRPTDFINFFRGVAAYGAAHGAVIEPMFIVNVNVTAQEAAAVVAFFNAEVGDPTPIGVDRHGMDWKTAGEWAALRATHGNPEPLRTQFWDIGNEVYGGKFGNPGCKASGWEVTWTCLGDEYMLGNDAYDGFIRMRAAMLAVDPTIQVGAVGVDDSSPWNRGVLSSGFEHIDYFVFHAYPSYGITGNPAKEQDEILAQPQWLWPRMVMNIGFAFDKYTGGQRLPIVMNEYELTPPWGKEDTRNYMNKHVNALFLADSLGQMMVEGVAMAAQWDVMNDKSDNYGNEFGLMRADGSNFRQPKYYIFPLWSRFGTTLLPLENSTDARSQLSAYAGRASADVVTLMVINKHRAEATATITLDGIAQITGGLADTLTAPALDSDTAFFNGNPAPADDLSDAPSAILPPVAGNTLVYTFPPISITLLRLNTQP